MSNKIPNENKKEFHMIIFVHLPIGFIFGFTMFILLIKFSDLKISLSGLLFVFLFVLAICIGTGIMNYRRLSKNQKDKEASD